MRKYGLEHFSVETLEKIENCSPEYLNKREQYWIKYYNTFLGPGYNEDKGGQGHQILDYEKIINDYKQTKCIKDVIKMNEGGSSAIHQIIRSNFSPEEIQKNGNKAKSNHARNSKPIQMLDKETEKVIKTFPSKAAACRYLNKSKNNSSAINQVTKGLRKSALGYKWKDVAND